jgi:aminopeptidase YwaD
MKCRVLNTLCFLIFGVCVWAQDMDYTRNAIRQLCSPSCFGRGYLKHGLENAANYLCKEIKDAKALPLFSTGYYQWFEFNVNTFPGNVSLKLNNKLLKPGVDYILQPGSGSLKGKFILQKQDSLNYTGFNEKGQIRINLKQKLTFGVASNSSTVCGIDLLNTSALTVLRTAEVYVQSKVLTKYINKNICAYVPGTVNNDTCIVFTAHYDHLGGLGKKTYFPGANDNASGVSMVLNLMKHYMAYPPKYKIVFVFFAGEEAGLLGSAYFVENKTLDLKKIKFLVNLDLLGTGDEGIMVVNGALHEKEFALLQSINEQEHLLPDIKKRGKAKNSDHYWFTEAGVPCFFIYTMGGIKAYHDVYDVEKTLPLTKYREVFMLLTLFVNRF